MQRCLPSRRQHAGRDDSELPYRGNKAGSPAIRISRDARADRAESVGMGLKNTSLQNIGSAIRASDRQPGMFPRYPGIDLGEPFIIGACPNQFVPNRDWIQSCPTAFTREARSRLAHASTDSRILVWIGVESSSVSVIGSSCVLNPDLHRLQNLPVSCGINDDPVPSLKILVSDRRFTAKQLGVFDDVHQLDS